MPGHSTTVIANIRAYDRIIGASPRPSIVLEHFAEQFLHALPGDHKRLPARGRRSIHPAIAPTVQCRAGSQIALPFHAVQDRIERARAQAIAMPTKLVNHRLAEDWALSSVMENMESDESRVQ